MNIKTWRQIKFVSTHFVGKRGLNTSPERKARNRTAYTLKNKLGTIKPQIFGKNKNNQPELKFTGSYKKKSVYQQIDENDTYTIFKSEAECDNFLKLLKILLSLYNALTEFWLLIIHLTNQAQKRGLRFAQCSLISEQFEAQFVRKLKKLCNDQPSRKIDQLPIYDHILKSNLVLGTCLVCHNNSLSTRN